MTEREILAFYKNLLNYAKRRAPDHAEDIASFGLVQILEGEVPNLKFRFVDYFRIHFGREGKYATLKRDPLSQPLVTHTHDLEGNEIDILELTEDPRDKTNSIHKFIYYKKFLTKSEIELFELEFYGYTRAEIGKILGVTEASICCRLSKAYERILKSKPPPAYQNYEKRRGAKPRKPICHPEGRHRAKGMCFECYDKARYARKLKTRLEKMSKPVAI